jgi:hypothetical protein
MFVVPSSNEMGGHDMADKKKVSPKNPAKDKAVKKSDDAKADDRKTAGFRMGRKTAGGKFP